jgi:hypothetical protein
MASGGRLFDTQCLMFDAPHSTSSTRKLKPALFANDPSAILYDLVMWLHTQREKSLRQIITCLWILHEKKYLLQI